MRRSVVVCDEGIGGEGVSGEGVSDNGDLQKKPVLVLKSHDGHVEIGLDDVSDDEIERLRAAGFTVRLKQTSAKKRRYSKLSKDTREKILEMLGNGCTIKQACEAAGVSVSYFKEYRRRHPQFDARVQSVMRARVEIIADALYEAGRNGNVKAQIFFLVNRTRFLPRDHPDKWLSLNSIEVSGHDNDKTAVRTELSLEEMRARIKQMLEEFVESGGLDPTRPRLSDIKLSPVPEP